MKICFLSTGIFLLLFSFCSPMKKNQTTSPITFDTIHVDMGSNSLFLSTLLNADPFFRPLLANKDQYKVQIIYTQIDRDKKNIPSFTDHFYDLNDTSYFYPASTIKFPIAVLALQKINELNIPGLNRNSSMITETAFEGQTGVNNDPTTRDGRPSVSHYIKKILLVSDNDASNRLYEFLGQEYINQTLHKMGYSDVQILHRLSIAMNEEQNRNTNPVRFFDTSGKLIYEKKPARSELSYADRKTFLGNGYYSGGVLKNEPFDFSKKNRLPLSTLHNILRSVMFPSAVAEKQRFNLTQDDHRFLWRYMSMFSNESRFPFYDTASFGPNYIKFILAGADKNPIAPSIRIFSKSGQAYGFLTDMTYVVDFENKVEFMVTATIHCNSDGIYNDDNYDYDKIGFPFMKNLGKLLYEHELKRKRKNPSDLDHLRFDYSVDE